jgi:hypothetical protein
MTRITALLQIHTTLEPIHHHKLITRHQPGIFLQDKTDKSGLPIWMRFKYDDYEPGKEENQGKK